MVRLDDPPTIKPRQSATARQRLHASLHSLLPWLETLAQPAWGTTEGAALLACSLLCAQALGPADQTGKTLPEAGLSKLICCVDTGDLAPMLRALQEGLSRSAAPKTLLLGLTHELSRLSTRRSRGSSTPERLMREGETLLSLLAPATRLRNGVYFTPPRLVRASVEALVHTGNLPSQCPALLALEEGFPEVLDPACGAGAFLHGILKWYAQAAAQEASGHARQRLWEAVALRLLQRLRGFELLPYCRMLAFAALRLFLEQSGLEVSALPLPRLEGRDTLECRPEELPEVRLVVGNPPWRRLSTARRRSPWEERLRSCEGVPLNERKHGLNDDYVRFFAWSLAVLEHKPGAALAFVSNNSYLTGSTLRGLREWLWQCFPQARIWDGGRGPRRGGESRGLQQELKIQQGICLAIYAAGATRTAVRIKSDHTGTKDAAQRDWTYAPLASVFNAPEAGARLDPCAPLFRFLPETLTVQALEHLRAEWGQAIPLTELFPVHSTGILTARDHLCLDSDRQRLLARLRALRDPEIPTDSLRQSLNIRDTATWRFEEARQALMASPSSDASLCTRILYRPFQHVWLLDHPALVWRLRSTVTDPMRAPGNLALLTTRMTHADTFAHALVSDCPAEVIALSPHTSSNAFVFPLYVMHAGARVLNVDALLAKQLGFPVAGPELVAFAYGILWCRSWRMRYHASLRDDFPRLPMIRHAAVRRAVEDLGHALIALHTGVKHPTSAPLEVTGDPLPLRLDRTPAFEPIRADGSLGVIPLTASAWLGPISRRAWDLQVGDYRVLEHRLRALRREKQAVTPAQLLELSWLQGVLDQSAEYMDRLEQVIVSAGGFPAILEQGA